jgi:hypothetical protein
MLQFYNNLFLKKYPYNNLFKDFNPYNHVIWFVLFKIRFDLNFNYWDNFHGFEFKKRAKTISMELNC